MVSPPSATASSRAAPVSSTKRAVGVVVFGSLVVGTAGLGSWQVSRYNWKIGKIERRKEELRAKPMPLDDVLAANNNNTASVGSGSGGSGEKAGTGLVAAAASSISNKRGAALDEANSLGGVGGFTVRQVVVAGVWEHDR
jgi:hypothetical protein